MMMYSYRWFYALALTAVILFMGAYFDVLPHIDAEKANATTEENLRRTLQVAQLSPKNSSYKISVNAISDQVLLAEITALMQAQGLKITSMKATEALKFRVIATATYAQWMAFLAAFNAQPRFWWLSFFTVQMTKAEELSVTMDMLLLTRNVMLAQVNASQRRTPWHPPFCVDENSQPISSAKDARLLQEIALADIRMTGYLQQGKRVVAWVTLPNEALLQVEKGAVIGKEKAVIIAIAPKELTLRLRDQTTRVMQGGADAA